MKDPARILQTVLVVEDDEPFRMMLVSALERRGYDARGVGDGDGAIAAARHDSPEMAVVDLRLPDMSGLDVVRELKAIGYRYVTIDLQGYRTGSLNEGLLLRPA